MPDGLILKSAVVEELVLQQRAANLSAETVVVVTLVLGVPGADRGLVDRIQVSILEVFIRAAMDGVGAAGDNDVELSAGGVTELRRELVGQQRKFLTESFGTLISGPVTDLLLLSIPSIVKLLLRGR